MLMTPLRSLSNESKICAACSGVISNSFSNMTRASARFSRRTLLWTYWSNILCTSFLPTHRTSQHNSLRETTTTTSKHKTILVKIEVERKVLYSAYPVLNLLKGLYTLLLGNMFIRTPSVTSLESFQPWCN